MSNKHGGYRKGSGAKLKYNEPTKVLSIRVPTSKHEYFKNLIETVLNKHCKIDKR